MLEEPHRTYVLDIAKRLIRTPSLTGHEGQLAQIVVETMRALGYHAVHTDQWGNVVGVVQGSQAGSVLFDAHMDTVPWQAQRWGRDPLGADVADGRLWGRGASDMKGAMAAAIYAGAIVGRQTSDLGTVFISCTVCEEPAEGPALVQVCERWRPRHVVILEASELNLNVGQRGRAELMLEIAGRAAHSASPHLGINAVRQMANLLVELYRLPRPADPALGHAQLEVTDIISEPYPGLSVVPFRCRATFDRRLILEDTADSIVDEVQQTAQRLGIEAEVRVAERRIMTYTGASFIHRAFAPAWKTDPSSALVRVAQAALRGAGQAPALGRYGFCTNGSGSAGMLGIPTIGYGPGREAEAHTVDEFLALDQLFAATAGYIALARVLSRL